MGDQRDGQLAINLHQAALVKDQLGLGGGDTWGIDGLARDLAELGFDLTDLNNDPRAMLQNIFCRSQEMVNGVDQELPSEEYEARCRDIASASARLNNGFMIAGVMAMATAGLGSRINVDIDGVLVNANAIVAVANAMIDPMGFRRDDDGEIDL